MSTYEYYAQGALDIARPPKVVLIERVNAINGLQLDPVQFELSQVQPETGINHNTSLWIMPAASSQWSNGFKVYYKRVAMSAIMLHVAEVPTNGAANLYTVLDKINNAYGIYLTEADVADSVITYSVADDTTSLGTLEIVARSTSVFFTGNIVIPVNNIVIHGVSTYDEEMLHFAAVRPTTGPDKIIAFNELNEQVDNYNFLGNVTINSSIIRTMWKHVDGTLTVLGVFDYNQPDGAGGTINKIDRVMKLNRAGTIENSTAGNLFGVNGLDVKYVPDFSNNRVYAIDPNNEIGGSTHGLHMYNEDGTHNNSYTPVLSGKVISVSPYLTKLYVVTQVTDAAPILTRLNLDGTTDSAFTAITLTFPSGRVGVDICRVASVTAAFEGITSVLYSEVASGAITWAEYSKTQQTGGIAPSVHFVDHDGVVMPGIGQPKLIMTSNRTGVTDVTSLVGSGSDAVFFSATVVNPSTGVKSNGMCTVKFDGVMPAACTQAVSDYYPAFINVKSITRISRGDMVVGANVQVEDAQGLRNAVGIYLYSYDGYFATQEVVLPGYTLIECTSHLFLQNLT